VRRVPQTGARASRKEVSTVTCAAPLTNGTFRELELMLFR
jgi:hypothetical protein